MEAVLSNRKLWIAGGVILLFIIFIVIFSSRQQESPPEFFINQIDSETTMPVSAIFRYEPSQEEFFVEEDVSWQNANFTRYIFDVAPKDSELEKCTYFIYDTDKGITQSGERRCNTSFVIRVGDGKACFSQGENKCFLYASAQDTAGRVGEYAISSYHIDYTPPEVQRPYILDARQAEVSVQFREENEYKVKVSDNLEVESCALYVDGVLTAAMTISSCDEDGCTASVFYAVESGEDHTASAVCGDRYSLQKGRYLNTTTGASLKIHIPVNRAPEIASCRVVPASGTISTIFSFSVIASDPNDDKLSYVWNFGDGEISNIDNPSYSYKTFGTFMPKVLLSDDGGLSEECNTAWVVIRE